MKINKQIIVSSLISIIVAGGIGYYVGSHRVSTASNMRQGMMGQAGLGARGGFARGASGGMVNGSVVSLTDNVLTLKARDGGSRVILFTAGTKVTKSVDGARTDVKDGVNVVILGTQNTDGSITAETVQIRPDGTSTMMMR
jgi:pectate lyase